MGTAQHGTVRGPAHPDQVNCAGTPGSRRRHARAVRECIGEARMGHVDDVQNAVPALIENSEERVMCSLRTCLLPKKIAPRVDQPVHIEEIRSVRLGNL